MGDDQYPRKLAQVVVAELLKAKGIEAVQLSSLEVLEDLLLRYLAELGRQAHKNAEIARRTVCNPLDVINALESQGITLDAIERYQKQAPDVDFAQPVCEFPVHKAAPQGQTFAQMKEAAPSNIPSFFPAFPEIHSYVETDTYQPADNTVSEQMKKIVEQKDSITEALVAVEERAASPEPEIEETKNNMNEQIDVDARENNPFLLPAKWEEKSNGDIEKLLEAEKMVRAKHGSRTESIVKVIEENLPIDLHPVDTVIPGKGMFEGWTWVNDMTGAEKLAKSGAKPPMLYNSGEGELVYKRQVEDLLTKSVAEEKEGNVIADLDMDLDDEEI